MLQILLPGMILSISFLEQCSRAPPLFAPLTAANPNFRRRLDHNDMYQYHVKGERGVKNPGVTPYYTKEFFAMLKSVC